MTSFCRVCGFKRDDVTVMKFMGTTQGMPQKGIIFGKKLSRKFSNALFRELQRYYGIKFLQTGEIYLNQSLRKKFVDFYLRLFQILINFNP